MTPLDAERAMLGAMLTGALRHADVVDAPDGLCGHLRHRRICDVLLSILDVRAERGGHPRSPGIDWRFAERTCKAAKVWPLAVVSIEPPQLCGLLELARAAPRRRGALDALSLVIDDARARADAKGERARLREAIKDALDEGVTSYLRTALDEATRSGHSVFTTTRRRGYGIDSMPHGTPGCNADDGHWIGADVIREELARVGGHP